MDELHQAGAITEEEYEILLSHTSEGQEDGSAEGPTFGERLITSEGADIDFTLIGIFEGVDTDPLTSEYNENTGGEKTLVFWEIHNHSGKALSYWHNEYFQYIGEDQIAYNMDANPLLQEKFEPGWRTEDWEEIADETRIRYVSPVEMPPRLDRIKISKLCSTDHTFEITDDMFFSESSLPVETEM